MIIFAAAEAVTTAFGVNEAVCAVIAFATLPVKNEAVVANDDDLADAAKDADIAVCAAPALLAYDAETTTNEPV